ncbi:major tail protein [Furfurilactobacillus entadae]|uniref:major tail protein n=1 Tax=Furfurilactobacillus entadae TaxID=2922307 RepID=UPI0035EBDE6C
MATTKKADLASSGFSRALMGILDQDDNVTKVIIIDRHSGGTIELKTSGFQGQGNTVFASNISYWISNPGVGTGKVELTLASLPSEVATEILGDELNEDGVYVTKGTVKEPYVAIIGETQDLHNNLAYVGIAKAKFGTTDGDDLKTGDDKGIKPENVSISGTAITRTDNVLKAKATTSDAGVTLKTFAKLMFPGFTGDLPATPDELPNDPDNTGHLGNGAGDGSSNTATTVDNKPTV